MERKKTSTFRDERQITLLPPALLVRSRTAPPAGGWCDGEAINPGASNRFRAPGASLRHDNL
jgi:hypothetical protein